MTQEVFTASAEETFSFAESFGKTLSAGNVIALYGELGAGKTIIAKGIAHSLGITEEITSPTFTLLEEYTGGHIPFYHFDLYRIAHTEEFTFLGFDEYWEGNGISVIEWAERAEELLPERTIRIKIEYAGNGRNIFIEHTCS